MFIVGKGKPDGIYRLILIRIFSPYFARKPYIIPAKVLIYSIHAKQ